MATNPAPGRGVKVLKSHLHGENKARLAQRGLLEIYGGTLIGVSLHDSQKKEGEEVKR